MLFRRVHPVRLRGVLAKQTDSMADNNQPNEWYLARDGQQHGPVTDAELKKIIELGYLKPTDLVWRHGMADWALAEAVLDLAPPPAPSAYQAPEPRMPGAQSRPAMQEAVRDEYGRQPAPHVRLEPEPAVQRRFTGSQPGPANGHLDNHGRFEQRAGPGPGPAAARGAYPGAGPYGQAPHAQPAGHAMEAQPHAHGGPAQHRDHGSPHEGQGAAGYVGGAGRPLPAPTPIARAEPRPPATEEDRIDYDERRGFPWRTAIVLALLAGLGAGGFALYSMGKLNNLPFLAAPVSTEGVPVIGRPASPARDETSAAAMVASQSSDAPSIEANLQKSPLWRVLKRDFPDWYQDRVAEVAKLASESKSDREINASLLRTVVELRRRHHPDALAASPERLKSMAASFVDNLARLSRESTAACYGYISQGEASPAVAELKNPEQRASIEVQLATIFDAVADGRKAPSRRDPPRREDYDILSAELGKRGWSPADLQLFTDARALSRAAPDKVCQMVQDWFAAQLAVGDEGAKIRLLGEALKPVVAG